MIDYGMTCKSKGFEMGRVVLCVDFGFMPANHTLTGDGICYSSMPITDYTIIDIPDGEIQNVLDAIRCERMGL